jgi:mycofactocin system glycosyltransferase
VSQRGSAAPPIPAGFRIALDSDNKQLDDITLFGGSPARVLRLTATGHAALTELVGGPIRSVAAGMLARRLTDAGVAHPRAPNPAVPIDATVIIPVRDRTAMLDRCLGALGRAYPVTVVDDASLDAPAVARIAAEHGATLIRRASNGGPAAARNTGVGAVKTDVVVFLDSDCVPPRGWIEQLAGHLADPVVAAVAPRIVALPASNPHATAGRYNSVCGSLDLGDREARVVPLARVAYVPTAALVVRRAALIDVADGPDVFDPALRVGEDVDLIWRLHDAGWRIRYDPAVRVGHHEPETWPGLLARRFRYGTSAAPLARRHPGAIPPLVLYPWPALAVVGLLVRRPDVAGAAYAASVVGMTRALRRAGVPTRGTASAMLDGVHQTWLGAGRYCAQFAAPLLIAAVVAPSRDRRCEPARRRWSRRVAAASLLLGPALTMWRNRRPPLDAPRFVLGLLADDMAYGSGVWFGCARKHTTIPLRPVICRQASTRRPDRPTPERVRPAESAHERRR